MMNLLLKTELYSFIDLKPPVILKSEAIIPFHLSNGNMFILGFEMDEFV